MMEKEEKNEKATSMVMRPPETEFILQWGNSKGLRCMRIRSNTTTTTASSPHHLSSSTTTRIRRKITSSRFLSVPSHDEKQLSFPPHPPSRLTRNSAEAAAGVTQRSESNRRVSPEKEERSSYTTRGSVAVVGNLEENGKVHGVDGHGNGGGAAGRGGFNAGGDEHNNNNGGHHINNRGDHINNRGVGVGGMVWPKLCIGLSSKEKEEDFMAMKGCRLPQRPKKRAKLIQRTLLLVSPGSWLTDMSLERYEVREKKTSKKRPRGLKAMGNVESDSE